MCGIVGYIGTKKAFPILISGLKNLEYRGYDSAGISTIEQNNLSVFKDKGRIKNLSNVEGITSIEGNIGIAHTRWATHGSPSRENAHPHLDNSNTFSVVHNGIIENYNELKSFLLKKGYTFYSQTDTEVIPNLIHYYYTYEESNLEQGNLCQNNFAYDDLNTPNTFLTAVKKTCDKLIGSYAIEVISKDFPGCIVIAKKNSPLVVGTGFSENYIASDIPAILEFTKHFYFLEDGEFGVITKNSTCFFDSGLNKIPKKSEEISWDVNSADKNGFEDYMLKEIYEQPDSIRKTISSRLLENGKYNFDDLNITKSYLENINKIYIIACGTAMHAGLSVKNTFEKLCNITTQVEIASEFRYKNPLVDSNSLCIFISQSGETADTLAALNLCKSKNSKTIAITNVTRSSITRLADHLLFTFCGPEIAVASTKAYTSQVVLLTMLCIYFSEILETTDSIVLEKLKSDILSLPDKLHFSLKTNEIVKDFAFKIYKEKDIFFLGRGIDYATALEASLKLKEISYIHSEAYPAGELKHGPIALIEEGTTVISVITDKSLASKSISNIQEVISRGAKTLVITNDYIEHNNFNTIITIPEIHSFISPVLAIIPLQLLSYHVAKSKNLDVDKPRNLAKSVTVE